MKKTKIDKLKLELYQEKLENGLEIYIIPKNNCNNIYATFSTKYGSNEIEFTPIKKKKMKKFPYGIAHFLEHKLFEMEDGTDPFEIYSNNGSDANANTSNDKTTYLFSGPQYFEENLNYLLDYVQTPYFTDKNVEKEKGIIIQEIKMYQDDPYSVLYEKALYNSFIKHPVKIPVIGDIENVKSITKEDLYECYNTFYNPSNMFIVITGNVDPEKTIKLIKENQEKKHFDKEEEIKRKTYEEPNKVDKKSEIIKMDISLPKLALNYKINYKDMNLNLRDTLAYLSIIFDINIGATSIENEELKDENIITSNIDFTFTYTDTHVLATIFGETDKIEKLTSKLESQIKNLEITEEEFERKKQNIASSYIFMSDNIFSMNEKLMNNIIKYNEIKIDDIKYTKRLNYKTAKQIIKELDLSNKSIVILQPK